MPPFHFLVFTRLACCRSIRGHCHCHCSLSHSERQKTHQWAYLSLFVLLLTHWWCAGKCQPGLSAFPFLEGVSNSMCHLPLNCVAVSYFSCLSFFIFQYVCYIQSQHIFVELSSVLGSNTPWTWTEPLWTWTYGSAQSSARWLNWTAAAKGVVECKSMTSCGRGGVSSRPFKNVWYGGWGRLEGIYG